ncbi:hypothetical protein G6K88_22005 [Agrobacterium rhizogenes]|nr:hypothetical protein [Rhizobium rhizogenes]NTH66579.1 hypothetical protein [Rhizobium rhizogenes]NTI04701.1 hypothetical protein [Rhizobium rhizogenes]NTI11510.1 hypothetical protein [Rhizobium rhizogenes]
MAKLADDPLNHINCATKDENYKKDAKEDWMAGETFTNHLGKTLPA